MKAILVLLIGVEVGFLLARREPTPSPAETMRTSELWLTGKGVTHSEPSVWVTQGDDGAWIWTWTNAPHT